VLRRHHAHEPNDAVNADKEREVAMVERMVKAALLMPGLYEEVEHDADATTQALLVVVLASVAAGIGAGLRGGLGGLVAGVIAALIGWALFALICYWVGAKLLAGPQTEATWGQLLRTLGFANSPGLLRILGFLPVLGGLITIVVSIWLLVAAVIAIRQALDFDTLRAIATAIIGWVIMLIGGLVVAALFGGLF